MHTMIFQPDDLFPGGLHNLLDHILVRTAIRAFPRIKHMVNGFVYGIPRVHRSQSTLGRIRVRLLGMCHFGDGHNT